MVPKIKEFVKETHRFLEYKLMKPSHEPINDWQFESCFSNIRDEKYPHDFWKKFEKNLP